MRQPDAQEGAVQVQSDVQPQDGHQRDLQGHHQHGHYHDEQHLAAGELHPRKAVAGKGCDQDRDQSGRNRHDQAVQEGVDEVIALDGERGAVGLFDFEGLAAQHLLVVLRGEFVVAGSPLLLLDDDPADAPVADPQHANIARLDAFTQLLEGAADALEGHHAAAVDLLARLELGDGHPLLVRENGPPTRGLNIELGAEGGDQQAYGGDGPRDDDQDQHDVDEDRSPGSAALLLAGDLCGHENASFSPNCFRL